MQPGTPLGNKKPISLPRNSLSILGVAFRGQAVILSRFPATCFPLKKYLLLNRQILFWILVAPWRGKGVNVGAVFTQIVRIGVQAVPMVSLTAFSIGLTLAMQGAAEMSRLGADAYVPDLVVVSLLRELGPLLTAVIVVGRSGSAVTAELGTMVVAEEIEALEAMAINPVRFLIVPRFLALMVMLPALTVFGNYIGMVGGWSICHFSLHMDTATFIMRGLDRAESVDLWAGVIKSVVFAWLIITIACYQGMTVRGGAEGVGRHTTYSVVYSLLAVLVANAVVTGLFFFL
jgi:phospholipid/cholesterol/gamma-HCH transport system permease protein